MTLAIEGLTRPAATVDSLQGDGSKNSHFDFTTVDSDSLEPGSTRMTGAMKHQTHHWDGKGLVLLAADDSGNQGSVEPASTLGESDASISRMDEPTLNSQHLSSALPHDIHAAIPDPDLETCPEEWRWLFEMLNGDGQDTQQSLGSYDLTSPCF
ncbi:hypothetical protein CC2G_004153 [Coprinopsis cinerea AmutBmut pab1-1]|nr:hypothetical protein CC2G_004153 [Coprinopsis cinerea AmutBmut pab1-1]